MLVLLLYAGLVQGSRLTTVSECDESVLNDERHGCVTDCGISWIPPNGNIWECYLECARLDLKHRSKCTNLTGLNRTLTYYSFPHIIRTIFRKIRSAPLLPPGLGVRESAHEQVSSLCPQPTQGYTHENRTFNRHLPALVASIPI